jgi:hypothetical protein
MSSSDPNRFDQMLMVIATLASIFIAWIEDGFIRSWSKVGWMSLPVVVSALASIVLIATLFPIRSLLTIRLRVWSLMLSVASVFCFLIEITPIAQGNNNSGEVFWIVTLPALLLLICAYRTVLKIKQLRTLEVTPWPQ